MCDDDAQVTGLGVSCGDCGDAYAALCDAVAEFALHSADPCEEASGAGWVKAGIGDGGEKPPDGPAVYMAGPADTGLGWDNIGLDADFAGEYGRC